MTQLTHQRQACITGVHCRPIQPTGNAHGQTELLPALEHLLAVMVAAGWVTHVLLTMVDSGHLQRLHIHWAQYWQRTEPQA